MKLLNLTKDWYEMVGLDHHKDRDCRFRIVTEYAYDQKPVFRVEHDGYIAGDIYFYDLPSMKAAENALITGIISLIKEESEWAEWVLANKKEFDKSQIKRAKKLLELRKKYANKTKRG